MTCSVMPGIHYPNEKSRCCGFQKDGIYIMKIEIVGRCIVVSDPLNKVVYTSEYLPALENYAVQSIGAIRSAQSGKLVVCIRGFYGGDAGMQSLIVSTDYSVREPVEYKGG